MAQAPIATRRAGEAAASSGAQRADQVGPRRHQRADGGDGDQRLADADHEVHAEHRGQDRAERHRARQREPDRGPGGAGHHGEPGAGAGDAEQDAARVRGSTRRAAPA